MKQRGWRLAIKRAVDRAAAAAGLITLAPVLGAVSIGIAVSMGRPVLFTQERPGRDGRLFRLVKFRTMRDARGPDGRPLPDDQRLTRIGKLIRSTSLDELPQLWNVLRGDMSLVGPRPLLVQYLPRYTTVQARRHDVLPGITGWAQVNGRNSLSWPEKFAHDVWYVDHWSLALDARILVSTLLRVLDRDGISNATHVTMPEFMG